MADRIDAMVAFLGGQLIRLRREGRKPGSNPAAELEAALRAQWPDVTPFEMLRVVAGLGEHLERAERMARPANDEGHA